MNRHFVAYFWFNGWSNLSLGLSVSLYQPNIEVHVPFGFFRIGWVVTHQHADRPHWRVQSIASQGAVRIGGVGYMD